MGELALEQVSHWHRIYEGVYRETAAVINSTFNITGWNSSYTGAPIPDDQMREWLDATVSRVRSLVPKRVLEIGCGAGLLLFQLAPSCEAYTATDFSAAAVRYVRSNLPPELLGDSRVRLLVCHADDFSGLCAANTMSSS